MISNLLRRTAVAVDKAGKHPAEDEEAHVVLDLSQLLGLLRARKEAADGIALVVGPDELERAIEGHLQLRQRPLRRLIPRYLRVSLVQLRHEVAHHRRAPPDLAALLLVLLDLVRRSLDRSRQFDDRPGAGEHCVHLARPPANLRCYPVSTANKRSNETH